MANYGEKHDLPIEQGEYQLYSGIDTWYDWSAGEVDQLGELCRAIIEAENAPTPKSRRYRWSLILKWHFVTDGNQKVADNTIIYNICSATECPNLGTDRCQVPIESCYAYSNEKNPFFQSGGFGSLDSRRRQQVIWDLLDAKTFAAGVLRMIGRMSNPSKVEAFRLDESGDFRHEGDVHKFNEVSRILSSYGIDCYCYSASSEPIVDWGCLDERHFTLNASNSDVAKYADRVFSAEDKDELLQSDKLICPAELHGRDNIKCGECKLCQTANAGDIYVPLH